MPKMKTRRAAAKRFTLTGSGKLKRNSAFRRHQLECKNRNKKRHLRGSSLVERPNVKQVSRMLAIGATRP
jgi:large subunit ribosomal protein L35